MILHLFTADKCVGILSLCYNINRKNSIITGQENDWLEFDDELLDEPGVAAVEQLDIPQGLVMDVQGNVSANLLGKGLQYA